VTRELKPIKAVLATREAKGLKPVRSIIPKPVPLTEIRLKIKRPSQVAEVVRELVGEQRVAEAIDATTDHAWLVVLGHFAQALGLTAQLIGVALPQRQGKNGPAQTKLIEFLVGILGGIDYLQDLNQGPQPIATDPTIAQAWAVAAFSHYSQVSRSLEAADEATLAGVIAALRQVAAPFIQAAVMEMVKRQGRLTVDVDLAGRPVSPTSTDYQEATFGWMDDEVQKGYQGAVSSLVSERWGRLMLTWQRYSGRTLSAECLQAAVQELESVLQVRPRRRVELVQARREELQAQLVQQQAKWDQQQQQEKELWHQLRAVKAECQQYQTEVSRLAAEYQSQGWTERPHSHLAKLRGKLAAAQKRESRAWRDLGHLQARLSQQHQLIQAQQTRLLALDEWLATLDADNRANPNPVTLILRVDAGFSTGANLTWLIEMGYLILTKAHHSQTSDSLRRQLSAHSTWTWVGQNADAVAMGDYQPHDCPYPLQAMLVRYHLPGKIRYTTLLYYGEIPPPVLPEWFKLYNGRQILEAGIKEEKGVFTLKRHLVRSPIGMQLQEQFALFGANFVRWAAAWVKDCLIQTHPAFLTALDQVKTLVRVVAHSRARWVRNGCGNVLIFETGPFAGSLICLAGLVALQLVLPLFNFAPS
jgi:hypothetical protein